MSHIGSSGSELKYQSTPEEATEELRRQIAEHKGDPTDNVCCIFPCCCSCWFFSCMTAMVSATILLQASWVPVPCEVLAFGVESYAEQKAYGDNCSAVCMPERVDKVVNAHGTAAWERGGCVAGTRARAARRRLPAARLRRGRCVGSPRIQRACAGHPPPD